MELLSGKGKTKDISTEAIERIREESIILGACETIKSLFPNYPDKPSLLKQIFPYLSPDDIMYWSRFYGLV